MNRKKTIPLSVVALGIVSFFTDTATEMIFPLIPVYVSLLGSGAIVLGIIEGVAETTASMLKLAGGVISDRTGKRKIFILIGYSISSIIRPFTGLVSFAWNIVLIRMIDRVGKGIRTAPRDALISSAAGPDIRGRAFGFHRAMDHAGAVAGPFAAIVVLLLLFWAFPRITPLEALRFTFIFAIIPGIMAILAIVFMVKERSVPGHKDGKQKMSYRSLDRNFFAYLSIVSLFTLGNSSDAFLLFRVAESLEKSGTFLLIAESMPFVSSILGRFEDPAIKQSIIGIFTLPFFWAFFHVLKSVLSTPLSGLSDKIGRKTVISMGWCVYALVYAGFAFMEYVPENLSIAAYVILFSVYAFYYAFTEGTEKALVADIVPERVRGSAFGAYNFAIGIFALPASIVFGVLYASFGAKAAFLLGAAIALASVAGLALFVREKKA